MWKKNIFADRSGYLFILPFYILFAYFLLIPIIEVIYYSLTDFNMFSGLKFIGFRNFSELWHDQVFLRSIRNTLVYLLFTLIPTMAIGLLTAVLLNTKLLNTSWARTLIFMPHIVSMVSVSMVWMWLYDPSTGMFNRILEALGIDALQWLIDPKTAMPSVILMGIWKGIGYNMIIFLAGLQGISRDYYEAAEVDGANVFQQFLRITVPLLAPATFFLFVTGVINSFNVFEQINIMTSGGPVNSTTTMVHQIYLRAFTEFKMGYASAQSVILLCGVLFITILNYRFGGSRKKYGED
ncbi:carbohydrate ABC transporter permease [Paenibacillus nasutitermitis]|uniref:Bicyclomycin resistance protein n=1 Tax=Paenibacillus nasutitermitis TaxID=1652958 RepID=A0A917E2E3_9BACL|nr:sugar ABC transporter permease [Paenibacillus nasutitermitis]GGD93922.1 bicyclomycin resistance protein [Paenibacillus nasutitermitis]